VKFFFRNPPSAMITSGLSALGLTMFVDPETPGHEKPQEQCTDCHHLFAKRRRVSDVHEIFPKVSMSIVLAAGQPQASRASLENRS